MTYLSFQQQWLRLHPRSGPACTPEIPKEDLVQLVVVVLAGMNQHMVRVPVQNGHDPGRA